MMMYVPVREDDHLTFVVADAAAAKAIAAASGRDALTPADLAAYFIEQAFFDLDATMEGNETPADLREYLRHWADEAFYGDFAGTWEDAIRLLKKTPDDLRAFTQAFDEAIEVRGRRD